MSIPAMIAGSVYAAAADYINACTLMRAADAHRDAPGNEARRAELQAECDRADDRWCRAETAMCEAITGITPDDAPEDIDQAGEPHGPCVVIGGRVFAVDGNDLKVFVIQEAGH